MRKKKKRMKFRKVETLIFIFSKGDIFIGNFGLELGKICVYVNGFGWIEIMEMKIG